MHDDMIYIRPCLVGIKIKIKASITYFMETQLSMSIFNFVKQGLDYVRRIAPYFVG